MEKLESSILTFAWNVMYVQSSLTCCKMKEFKLKTQLFFYKSYGVGAFHDDTRMTGQRCAHLMVTAIANRLEEVWISKHPILFFTYMAQYCPTVTKL